MAKYTVEHACGHTHEYHQLFGPLKERDRKLEWLAEQDCPDCRREAELAKAMADETPVTAEIIPMLAYPHEPGTIELTIVFKGGTYRRKGELERIACYGELPAGSGLFGLLNAHERKGWHTRCVIGGNELKGVDGEGFLHVVSKHACLPDDIKPILPSEMTPDLALLEERMLQAIRESDALASLPKEPEVHELPDLLGVSGHWNGKFYGKSGLDIYVDGNRMVVPADTKTRWEAEAAEHSAWLNSRDSAIESLRAAQQ